MKSPSVLFICAANTARSQMGQVLLEHHGQQRFGGQSALRREAWPFEDPAAATGSEEDQRVVFRQVRDQIDAQVRPWVEAQG